MPDVDRASRSGLNTAPIMHAPAYTNASVIFANSAIYERFVSIFGQSILHMHQHVKFQHNDYLTNCHRPLLKGSYSYRRGVDRAAPNLEESSIIDAPNALKIFLNVALF